MSRSSTSRGRRPKAWEIRVGVRPYVVIAYERADKDDTVYLRWWPPGATNWKKKSLGVSVRDAQGRVMRAQELLVEAAAREQYAQLTGTGTPATPAPVRTAPLTLGEAWALLSDRGRGLYPTDTAHRREVKRALEDACRILGPALPWAEVRPGSIRQLGRTRCDEVRQRGRRGLRPAEITVARVLTVASWLRDEGHIPSDAALVGRRWREELRRYWREASGAPTEYEPSRPRYTLEEMRQILRCSAEQDPRLELALGLGAELRLGQVRHAWRSMLTLAPEGMSGTFQPPSRGKKRAAPIALTSGQLALVRRVLTTGYLRLCERSLPDYPLFPGGPLLGQRTADPHAEPARVAARGVIGRKTLRDQFLACERAAGIAHLDGRGWYGIRRQSTDAFLDAGATMEQLQNSGGWADEKMPLSTYRDRGRAKTRDEAAEIRAKVRGEES
jgi:hypothetical protein